MLDKIKELRSTPRGNAAFKLSLYLVFLIVVAVLLLVGNKMSPKKSTSISSVQSTPISEKENRTYYEKQEFLLEGKYDFKYEIHKPLSVTYEGSFDNGKVDGFKETEDDLIRYSIENGEVFRTKLTSREKYDELYEGLDESQFDLKAMFTKLNAIGPEVKREENKKIYMYNNPGDYKYVVTSVDEYISKIEVSSEDLEYIFEFEY